MDRPQPGPVGLWLRNAAAGLCVLAAAAAAVTRKVCGRILRRVAAGFGEDIAPDAASAWG